MAKAEIGQMMNTFCRSLLFHQQFEGETDGDECDPAAHRPEAQPVRPQRGGDGEGGHGRGTSHGHEVRIDMDMDTGS